MNNSRVDTFTQQLKKVIYLFRVINFVGFYLLYLLERTLPCSLDYASSLGLRLAR